MRRKIIKKILRAINTNGPHRFSYIASVIYYDGWQLAIVPRNRNKAVLWYPITEDEREFAVSVLH